MPDSTIFRVFHGLRPGAWLRVTGEDAPGFLQGQFSQDVKGLALGAAAYGFWLDHKGRVEADSFVVASRDRGEFWVGSIACPAEVIQRRLEKYIVADDVSVEDQTAQWRLAVVWCGDAPPLDGNKGYRFAGRPAAGATPEARARSEAEPARVADRSEMVVAVPSDAWEEVRSRFIVAGLAEVGAGAAERTRILSGIASVPKDLGPGDLPQEAGLGDAAVSYTKGCFIGQEVMSRLKTRGRIRRRLRRVRWTGALPGALPAAVWSAGRQIGQVRSAVEEGEGGRCVGLAMLPADVSGDAGLSLAPGGAIALRIDSLSQAG